MSYLRAAARKRPFIAAAVQTFDQMRNSTLRQEMRVLTAVERLKDFIQNSPFLSSRHGTVTVDESGAWLRIANGPEFLLNHESWGMLTIRLEELEREAILRAAASSAIIFDVGANFGFHSVAIAHAHPTVQVHAFEPVPRTADILTANVRRNGCRQVIVVRAAVSNIAGEVPITTEFTTGNYIASHERGIRSRTVLVPSIRLDDYWRQIGRPKVGVMKVDVEGAEWLVLDSARELLRSSRPTLLLELYDQWLQRFGKNRRDCVAILIECGYRQGRGVGVDESWQPLDAFEFTRATNYLFEGLP